MCCVACCFFLLPPLAGKPDNDVPGGDAVSTWRTYSSKCAGKKFDPKKTTQKASECASLSGKLCSRKDVKCGAGKTDFLDGSGKVVATGTNEDGLLCPKDGTACIVA